MPERHMKYTRVCTRVGKILPFRKRAKDPSSDHIQDLTEYRAATGRWVLRGKLPDGRDAEGAWLSSAPHRAARGKLTEMTAGRGRAHARFSGQATGRLSARNSAGRGRGTRLGGRRAA
jgi:hypothetical protein